MPRYLFGYLVLPWGRVRFLTTQSIVSMLRSIYLTLKFFNSINYAVCIIAFEKRNEKKNIFVK